MPCLFDSRSYLQVLPCCLVLLARHVMSQLRSGARGAVYARTAGEQALAKTAGAAVYVRTVGKEALANTAGAAVFARTAG